MRGLRTAGFTVFPTRGTYFVVTDVTPLGFDDGAAFCWRLPELIGVAAVPVSVFCADPDAAATCHAARQPLLHGRGLATFDLKNSVGAAVGSSWCQICLG